MKNRFLTLCTLALLNPSIGYAKEGDFNDYMQKIVQHPGVLEILEKSERRLELSTAAMGLPDPTIILGVDNLPVDNPSFDKYLPSAKTYGFSQKIPNYSLRKARSNQQKQLSVKDKLVADFTKERLENMFISMLVKLEKVGIQEELATKQLENYKELETYFNGRLEAGNGVYWRFSQIDVERSSVEQELNNLKAEREAVREELINLVGEVPHLKIDKVDSELWHSGKDLYPVSIAKELVTVSEYGVAIADAAYGSNYGVKALYKQRESGNNFDGQDWFSVQASMSIPLWYNWNQEPKKRAALAKNRSSEQAYENTKRLWIQKLKTLESERDAALNNIHVLVHEDKAFKEMVGAARRTYESGESTLEALLEAKIRRLSIQSQLAKQRFLHVSLLAEINSYIRN